VRRQGFTLIELLITIAIIGILAGAAATAYIGVIKKGARMEAYNNLESLYLLENKFFDDNGSYTGNFADLPDFRPGPSTLYTYALSLNVALPNNVTVPYDGSTVAQTPCFIATATGIANSRVAGDVFAIDCNNNRNF